MSTRSTTGRDGAKDRPSRANDAAAGRITRSTGSDGLEGKARTAVFAHQFAPHQPESYDPWDNVINGASLDALWQSGPGSLQNEGFIGIGDEGLDSADGRENYRHGAVVQGTMMGNFNLGTQVVFSMNEDNEKKFSVTGPSLKTICKLVCLLISGLTRVQVIDKYYRWQQDKLTTTEKAGLELSLKRRDEAIERDAVVQTQMDNGDDAGDDDNGDENENVQVEVDAAVQETKLTDMATQKQVGLAVLKKKKKAKKKAKAKKQEQQTNVFDDVDDGEECRVSVEDVKRASDEQFVRNVTVLANEQVSGMRNSEARLRMHDALFKGEMGEGKFRSKCLKALGQFRGKQGTRLQDDVDRAMIWLATWGKDAVCAQLASRKRKKEEVKQGSSAGSTGALES